MQATELREFLYRLAAAGPYIVGEQGQPGCKFISVEHDGDQEFYTRVFRCDHPGHTEQQEMLVHFESSEYCVHVGRSSQALANSTEWAQRFTKFAARVVHDGDSVDEDFQVEVDEVIAAASQN